ncbi:MAG: hypothetical protein R3F60_21375 [bacterium]
MVHSLSCLDEVVGSKLTGIARILYEFNGEIEPDDGAVELTSEGFTALLEGSGDGESLRVREAAWKDPFEAPLSPDNYRYAQEHGRWRRIDCSTLPNYSDLVGREVTEIRPLANEHGRIAGLRISVPNRTMWFVVQGDECHVRWAHPTGFTEAPRPGQPPTPPPVALL